MRVVAMDIFISSPEEAIDRYRELSEGNSFSCVTAQPVEFLVYHEVAKQVLLRTRPNLDLTDKVVLRYPWIDKAPKNTNELFSRFKPIGDFDTKFGTISEYLISASPSLEQKESNESAWGIFVDPERGDLDVDECIRNIFMKEKVYFPVFENKIAQLIKDAPTNTFKGMLTVITAKKKKDVADFVYNSLPYGLPGVDHNNPQLRIVSAALLPSDKVKMHRVLLMEETDLKAFSEKVRQVVADIFFENDQNLKALENKIEQGTNPQEIALEFLKRHEVDKALGWALKTDESIRYEFFKMLALVCIQRHDQEKAKKILSMIPDGYFEKEKYLAMLVFYYLNTGLPEVFAIKVLNQMKEGNTKNLIILYALGLTGNAKKYIPNPNFTQDLEDLGDLLDLTFHPIFNDKDEEDEIEELIEAQPLWKKNLDASIPTHKVFT